MNRVSVTVENPHKHPVLTAVRWGPFSWRDYIPPKQERTFETDTSYDAPNIPILTVDGHAKVMLIRACFCGREESIEWRNESGNTLSKGSLKGEPRHVR